MILTTSLSIQCAGAVAHPLFAQITAPAVSSIRFVIGAVILLVLVRPRWRGRSTRTWQMLAAYGLSLAALNLAYFQAISLIPMGITMIFASVPPLLFALVTSRRALDVVWVALAAAGVVILSGISPPRSLPGVLCALAAGVAWIAVAQAARQVGQLTQRVDGLALALPFAALVTIPFGIAHADQFQASTLTRGLIVAILGLVLAFALELEGLRRLPTRTVAIIYSIDPANAAIVGLIALGQQLTAPQLIAMATVITASLAATLTHTPS